MSPTPPAGAPAEPSTPSSSARWSPSVTVAAVISDGGQPPRYLLVEEHTPEGLKLNNPAGHLDSGESPQEAVVREALEETARVFTPQSLVGVYLSRFLRPAVDAQPAQDVTYLRIAYAGTVGPAEAGRVLDTPIVRTLWLTLAELRDSVARHRSELVLRCVEDHARGQQHPLQLVQADASVWAPVLKT
jgi:8-oxo-dGTP pyrophosphatase MutT (NUDIX family)